MTYRKISGSAICTWNPPISRSNVAMHTIIGFVPQVDTGKSTTLVSSPKISQITGYTIYNVSSEKGNIKLEKLDAAVEISKNGIRIYARYNQNVKEHTENIALKVPDADPEKMLRLLEKRHEPDIERVVMTITKNGVARKWKELELFRKLYEDEEFRREVDAYIFIIAKNNAIGDLLENIDTKIEFKTQL